MQALLQRFGKRIASVLTHADLAKILILTQIALNLVALALKVVALVHELGTC